MKKLVATRSEKLHVLFNGLFSANPGKIQLKCKRQKVQTLLVKVPRSCPRVWGLNRAAEREPPSSLESQVMREIRPLSSHSNVPENLSTSNYLSHFGYLFDIMGGNWVSIFSSMLEGVIVPLEDCLAVFWMILEALFSSHLRVQKQRNRI